MKRRSWSVILDGEVGALVIYPDNDPDAFRVVELKPDERVISREELRDALLYAYSGDSERDTLKLLESELFGAEGE